MTTMKEFKRISVPLKFKDNIDHLLKSENPPIISCKNRRLNFDPTTPKLKWDNRYLINSISKLPAWDLTKCTFSDLGLSTDVVNALKENRFVCPTNIQISTIPTILIGLNTILGGETGGGKICGMIYAAGLRPGDSLVAFMPRMSSLGSVPLDTHFRLYKISDPGHLNIYIYIYIYIVIRGK